MKEKLTVGGQAVIEGVMMRGPKIMATAVRKQDGSIVYKQKNISSTNTKLFKLPFVRGCVALFDAMVTGTKELIFASNQAGLEEEKLTDKEVLITVSTSLAIGVGLFMVIPSLIGSMVFKDSKLYANILEAILRLSMFITYIYVMTKFKEMKRVFEYHGAEHKSIMTYENDLELTPKSAKKSTRFHPRCGTSFLILVMFISIFVFSFVDYIFPLPKNKLLLVLYKLATRVPFIPLVASLSYEIQKWASNHLDNIFAKIVSTPGLWLQKLTTQEPDEEQLEVALVALKISLGETVDNATEVFE